MTFATAHILSVFVWMALLCVLLCWSDLNRVFGLLAIRIGHLGGLKRWVIRFRLWLCLFSNGLWRGIHQSYAITTCCPLYFGSPSRQGIRALSALHRGRWSQLCIYGRFLTCLLFTDFGFFQNSWFCDRNNFLRICRLRHTWRKTLDGSSLFYSLHGFFGCLDGCFVLHELVAGAKDAHELILYLLAGSVQAAFIW